MSRTTEPLGDLRVAMQFPEGWEAVPLEPAAARALIRQRLEGGPEPQRDRRAQRRLERMVSRMVSQVSAAGVVLAAVWNEVVVTDEAAPDVELPDEAAGLLTSVVTVAVLPAPSQGGSLTATLLEVALRTRPASPGRLIIEDPGRVELPAGSAVRQAWLRESAGGARSQGEPTYLIDRFLVPAPDGGAVALDFQTPNVGLHGDLRPLYLEVAATVRFIDGARPENVDAEVAPT